MSFLLALSRRSQPKEGYCLGCRSNIVTSTPNRRHAWIACTSESALCAYAFDTARGGKARPAAGTRRIPSIRRAHACSRPASRMRRSDRDQASQTPGRSERGRARSPSQFGRRRAALPAESKFPLSFSLPPLLLFSLFYSKIINLIHCLATDSQLVDSRGHALIRQRSRDRKGTLQ